MVYLSLLQVLHLPLIYNFYIVVILLYVVSISYIGLSSLNLINKSDYSHFPKCKFFLIWEMEFYFRILTKNSIGLSWIAKYISKTSELNAHHNSLARVIKSEFSSIFSFSTNHCINQNFLEIILLSLNSTWCQFSQLSVFSYSFNNSISFSISLNI